MIDRQKLETILIRRFPGASHEQVAAAANAIMGLDAQEKRTAVPDIEVGVTLGEVDASVPHGRPRRKASEPHAEV
jgi:hypothetical protein